MFIMGLLIVFGIPKVWLKPPINKSELLIFKNDTLRSKRQPQYFDFLHHLIDKHANCADQQLAPLKPLGNYQPFQTFIYPSGFAQAQQTVGVPNSSKCTQVKLCPIKQQHTHHTGSSRYDSNNLNYWANTKGLKSTKPHDNNEMLSYNLKNYNNDQFKSRNNQGNFRPQYQQKLQLGEINLKMFEQGIKDAFTAGQNNEYPTYYSPNTPKVISAVTTKNPEESRTNSASNFVTHLTSRPNQTTVETKIHEESTTNSSRNLASSLTSNLSNTTLKPEISKCSCSNVTTSKSNGTTNFEQDLDLLIQELESTSKLQTQLQLNTNATDLKNTDIVQVLEKLKALNTLITNLNSNSIESRLVTESSIVETTESRKALDEAFKTITNLNNELQTSPAQQDVLVGMNFESKTAVDKSSETQLNELQTSLNQIEEPGDNNTESEKVLDITLETTTISNESFQKASNQTQNPGLNKAESQKALDKHLENPKNSNDKLTTSNENVHNNPETLKILNSLDRNDSAEETAVQESSIDIIKNLDTVLGIDGSPDLNLNITNLNDLAKITNDLQNLVEDLENETISANQDQVNLQQFEDIDILKLLSETDSINNNNDTFKENQSLKTLQEEPTLQNTTLSFPNETLNETLVSSFPPRNNSTIINIPLNMNGKFTTLQVQQKSSKSSNKNFKISEKENFNLASSSSAESYAEPLVSEIYSAKKSKFPLSIYWHRIEEKSQEPNSKPSVKSKSNKSDHNDHHSDDNDDDDDDDENEDDDAIVSKECDNYYENSDSEESQQQTDNEKPRFLELFNYGTNFT